MEIVISKPKKPDEELDARIDNKRRFHLKKKGLRTFTKHKIKKGELFTIKNLCFKRINKKTNAMEPKTFFLINKRKSNFNLDKGIILKKRHYSFK